MIEFKYDIDFIIGYLKHCNKLNHDSQKIQEILIFMLEEIKKLKEQKE